MDPELIVAQGKSDDAQRCTVWRAIEMIMGIVLHCCFDSVQTVKSLLHAYEAEEDAK